MIRPIAFALLLSTASPLHAASDDPWAGLWGCEHDFQPVPAQLTVTDSADTRSIKAGIFPAMPTEVSDRFEFAVHHGTIRLHRVGDAFEGFWIQPAGTVHMQPYAAPLRLELDPAAPNRRYTGRFPFLPDRVRLYLQVGAREAGKRQAFVREPEHNIGAMLGTLRVEEQGDSLALFDRDGRRVMRGLKVAGMPDTLRLALDTFGIELVLTRRGRDEAPGFYPRKSTDSRYEPRAPRDLADGWRVGSPGEAGLDSTRIRAFVQALIDSIPTRLNSPAPHAILIARRGILAVDEYFCGYGPEDPHDLRSAGKSFGSTLVGTQVDRGKLALDTRVSEVYRATDPQHAADPRHAAMEVRHLLSMSSGLACYDNDDTTPGNEDRMQSQSEQNDWWRYLWSLDLTHDPGTHAAYCSCGFNLAGAVVAEKTGEWLPELFVRDIAEPLGFRNYHLNLMPNWQGYLAGGQWIRPRDLAKLPQAFLDGGRWQGRQVFSQAWVDSALAPRASIRDSLDYGLGWWRTTLRSEGRDYAAFYASGNGGQLAVAVPALELVVVLTSGNFADYRTWRRYLEEWIPQRVLPAVVR